MSESCGYHLSMIQIKVGREWRNAPNAVDLGDGVCRMSLGIYGIVFYRKGEWKYEPVSKSRSTKSRSTSGKSQDKLRTPGRVRTVKKLAGKTSSRAKTSG